MPRSTPGTRLRRQLVHDLQTVRARLDTVKSIFSPRSVVYEDLTTGEGWANYTHRPRREDEYPENIAGDIAHAHAQLSMCVELLNEERDKLARRYRELLELQQREVKA